MAAADPQDPAVSLVYAARDELDVEQSGDWQPLGMRASESVALRRRGTVPAGNLIGGDGAFKTIADEVFAPLAHLGWSAAWLGTAAGALSRTVTVLRAQRRGAVQSELLLHEVLQAVAPQTSVHALLRHTTAAYEKARSAGRVGATGLQLLLNGLKITASEQCWAAVEDLVDATGLRHGYLRGSPTGLERALRDLRSAPLNYSNDRLHLADGRLALIDSGVNLV